MSHSRTIWQRFDKITHQFAKKNALVDSQGRGVTFENLYHKSQVLVSLLAREIDNRKSGPGGHFLPTRVGVICARVENAIASLLALSCVRAVAVPLDAGESYAVSRNYSSSLNCEFHLIDGPHRWSDLDISIEIIAETPTPPIDWAKRRDSEPFYILSTTGTTGPSKGVLQSETNLTEHIDAYVASVGISSVDRLTLLPSICTDAGFMDLFSGILTGATLFSWDVRQLGLTGLPQWLATQKITVLHTTPSLLAALIRSAPSEIKVPNIRSVVLGGEALRPSHLAGFGGLFSPSTRLVNGYGPTECTLVSQAQYDNVLDFVPGCIGREVAGVHVCIDAPSHADCRGEIIVVSDRLALGYADASKTAERFFFDHNGRYCYRTGDLGIRAPDGSLRFLGRTDRKVKIHGYFVDCEHIEDKLRETPHVTDAYVGENTDGELHAWITAKTAINEETLRNSLTAVLSAREIPQRINSLSVIPRTASGKVDVQALKSAAAPRRSYAPFGGSNTLRETIEHAARLALQIPHIPEDKTFFELGGDSLSFLVFIAELNNQLKVGIPPTPLFANLNLASLENEIRRIELHERKEHGLKRTSKSQLTQSEIEFWLAESIGVGRMTPRVHFALGVNAPLDVKRLKRSFAECFSSVPKLSMQVTIDTHGYPKWRIKKSEIPELEVCEIPASERDDWVSAVVRTPLSCIEGPVLRACVGRLPAGDFCIAIVVHHAYMDGVSIREFLKRWFAYYDGGCAYPLEHEDIIEECDEKEVDQWARYIGVAKRAKYPRQRGIASAISGDALRVKRIEITSALEKRLLKAAAKHGSHPFAVWALSFASALDQTNGEPDVVIPTIAAGRSGRLNVNSIGCFVNTVYARCRLTANALRRDLLQSFIQEFSETASIQNIPRQLINKRLGWLEPGASLPNVFLLYHSWRDNDLSVQDCRAHRILSCAEDLRVPLSLEVTRTRSLYGDKFSAEFTYDGHLIEKSVFEDFEERFVAELNIWSRVAAEEEDAFEATYPSPWKTSVLVGAINLSQIEDPGVAFLRHADLKPRDVAIVCRDRNITYEELASSVRATVKHLSSAGVTRLALVPIRCTDPIRTITTWLAAWLLDAAFVTIPTEWPAERFKGVLDRFCFRSCVDDGGFVDLKQSTLSLTKMHSENWRILSHADGQTLAYGCFTSGTTGVPRLALISRRSLLNRLAWMRQEFTEADGPQRGVITLASTPFEYDSAIWQVLWPLSTGGTVAVPERGDILSARRLLELVSGAKATVLDFVPSVLAAIMPDMIADNSSRESLKAVRHVILGGERVDMGVFQQALRLMPEARFTNLYGTTETTIGSVAHCIEFDEHEIPLGRPIPGTWCAVVDSNLRPLPPGTEGEIILGGLCVGEGYLDDPVGTTERFKKPEDDPCAPGAFFCTGDRGLIVEPGLLTYCGRLDSQVKRFGARVNLEAIENSIMQSPGVQAAGVVMCSSGELVAFIVAENGLESAIRVSLIASLPPVERPNYTYTIPFLPLTSSGKIDRRALSDLAAARLSKRGSEIGETTGKVQWGMMTVKEVWSKLLGVSDLSEDATFFELGGHSLLVIEAAAQLTQRIGKSVSIGQIFEHPTARQLGAEIDRVIGS